MANTCCVGQEQARQADSFAAEQQRLLAKNPAGVTLTLRLEEDRSTWRQGEIIGVELEFRAEKRRTYHFDNTIHDRSGRLGIDAFHLDPKDGAVDPLSAYFHGQRSGFMGGISSPFQLGGDKHVIRYEVNEWFRFEKPGKYRLYVDSGRISHSSRRREMFPQAIPLVSNIIEFEVLPPDAEWQEDTLRQAVSLLAAPSQTPAFGEEAEMKHRSLCRALRFLNTKEAAREMIRLYRGTDPLCAFEYFLGLVGSPHQEFIVAEMEKAIADPQQPISLSYLDTLSRLVVGLKSVPRSSSPPGPAGEQARIKAEQERLRKTMDAQHDFLLVYARKLYAALPGKQAAARAVSVKALLDLQGRLPPEKKTAEVSSWAEKLPAELAGGFSDLAPESQSQLLDSRWVMRAGPAMVPALKRLFDSPPEGADQYFRGAILQQIYNVSPVEGRELILKEISRERHRVEYRSLSVLPDESIPELDDILAAHLEKHVSDTQPTEEEKGSEGQYDPVETISRLIERYATPAIISRVKAVYRKVPANSWACLTQAAMIAYISRAEPATGKELIAEALAARDEEQSRCFTSVLSAVADLHMSPELEELAAGALADVNPEVVSKAASVLGSHGSAAAEAKLWQRLEQWHAEWRARAPAMRGKRPALPDEGVDPLETEALIESALVRALTGAQAWIADKARLERLRTLCLTNVSCGEVDKLLKAGEPTISITFNEADGKPLYMNVSQQYHPPSMEKLRQKLSQYPAGTTFRWETSGTGGKEAQSIANELKNYLELRGYKLNLVTPAPPSSVR